MLDDDIELTIDVVDLVKSCNDWGYHYGFVMNISSRSLAGRAYNIKFNAYLYASLGKGKMFLEEHIPLVIPILT